MHEQGCSGAGIIPGSQCPFGLSKFQEVRPAPSSFQLPKSLSHCVIRTVARSDVLKKKDFRPVFPDQVACISKPTRSLSVLHTWNAVAELERNRLSHEASPWRHVNLLHKYCQARLKGRIDCAGRGRSTYRAPTFHEPQGRATIEKSREGTTFYLQQDWSAQPLDFWRLSKVIQCRTFSIRTGIYPTHPLPNVVRIFRKVR